MQNWPPRHASRLCNTRRKVISSLDWGTPVWNQGWQGCDGCEWIWLVHRRDQQLSSFFVFWFTSSRRQIPRGILACHLRQSKSLFVEHLNQTKVNFSSSHSSPCTYVDTHVSSHREACGRCWNVEMKPLQPSNGKVRLMFHHPILQVVYHPRNSDLIKEMENIGLLREIFRFRMFPIMPHLPSFCFLTLRYTKSCRLELIWKLLHLARPYRHVSYFSPVKFSTTAATALTMRSVWWCVKHGRFNLELHHS